MLVKHSEVIVREEQPYEVVCADEKVFVIAPMKYNKAEECVTTDYERLEAYSNDETVNTLEELKFERTIEV